jgi:hypothetical protein
VTGGGNRGKSSLFDPITDALPKVPTNQAWIVYVALGAFALVGVVLAVKLWR